MDDGLKMYLLLFNTYNLNIMAALPGGAFLLVVTEMVTFSSYCCWTNETTKVTLLLPSLSREKTEQQGRRRPKKSVKKKKAECADCESLQYRKKIKEKNNRKSKVTSGARYSGVPQKVFMVAASVMPSLHRPKSVIFICPSLSSIRFSN